MATPMRVILLGTGSALPTPERRTSATAVLFEGEMVLFDCGEGTQLQLRRAGLRHGRLSRIFISHMHGDHVIGIMGLLMTMELSGRERPIELYGPPALTEYVTTSARLLSTGFSYPIIFHEARPGVICEAEMYVVECLPLDHRILTYGYAFQERDKPGTFDVARAEALGIPKGPLYGRLQRGQSIALSDGRTVHPHDVLGPPKRGRRIAYCLDTRPCPQAAELARDADLLLYDSTLAAGAEQEAAEKGHSTSRQAAVLAKEAGARRLVLTHISSRYPDARALLTGLEGLHDDVMVARDLMELSV
ncbi:MAG TPA: ribonuclease Z [Alphaproteobacteria bacterium]|nr:ribonuclease Z [Alphaproteobacteria bacterium]